jgi:hypothetical protein
MNKGDDHDKDVEMPQSTAVVQGRRSFLKGSAVADRLGQVLFVDAPIYPRLPFQTKINHRPFKRIPGTKLLRPLVSSL